MDLRYKEIAKLGSGVSGRVYSIKINDRAVNSSELFAVKRVSRDMTSHYTILREIMALRTLRHPNIVDCYDIKFGDSKTNTEIFMPMYGQNLRNFMDTTKLKDRILCLQDVVLQLCTAVQYMHSRGFVHRDIKPDNILISYSGSNISKPRIVLADLGLAKQIGLDVGRVYDADAKTLLLANRFRAAAEGDIAYMQHTQEVCTLNYRPPELLSNPDYIFYSGSIDIWALGCTLYEYITRRFLFSGDSESEVQKTIDSKMKTNWELFMKVEITRCVGNSYQYTDKFVGIVKRMVQSDPEKRVNSNRLLIYLGGDPVVPEIRYFTRQPLSSPTTRDIYVMNIVDVLQDYDLSVRSILLAVDLFDLYIASQDSVLEPNYIERQDLAKISQTCVYMASKIYDFTHLRIDQVTTVYSRVEIAATEKHILESIDFNIPAYTLLDVMETSGFTLIDDRLTVGYEETIAETILEFVTEYHNLENQNINSIRETLWALI